MKFTKKLFSHPSSSPPSSEQSSRSIYLLYTGGTIGSIPGPEGLEPADLEGFQNLLKEFNQLGPNPDKGITDLNISDNVNQNIDVNYDLDVLDPPLDSTEMEPKNWYQIAYKILNAFRENPSYDGAVVLHGTDTLGYTSSALAFLLQGLKKPVVVTGSQIPLIKPRSDALRNFVSSVAVAAGGSYKGLQEVAVVFSSRIYRGCRVTKVNADEFCGFDTPNYPYLGDNALTIEYDKSAMFRVPRDKPEYMLDSVEDFKTRMAYLQTVCDGVLNRFSVIVLHLFPGINASMVRNMIFKTEPQVRAIVVRSYGAGNVQDNISKKDGPLYDAWARGIAIVNTTQVLAGRVSVGTYASSANMALISSSGLGMTTEAAVTKLVSIFATPKLYLRDPPDWNTDPIRFRKFAEEIIKKNIVGEIGFPGTRPGEPTS